MFLTIALFVLGLVAGAVIGAALHASIATEAAATKSEISAWALRLRSAAIVSAGEAKIRMDDLIADIEKKL